MKAEKQDGIMNILDEETGNFVPVSAEKQRMAAFAHQQVLMGVFISAMALKKMIDEKLYLGLGCGSREEYLDNQLPFGRSQAYMYLKVANKFESVFQSNLLGNGGKVQSIGLLEGEKVQSIGLSFDGDKEKVTLNSLSEKPDIMNLGLVKLYELTKLDDEDLNTLIDKGSVTINGKELTFDEIKDMTSREASKKIAEIKDKYSKKVNQLSEEVKLANEEKEYLLKQMEENNKKVKDAEMKELKYGQIGDSLSVKNNRLDEARKALNEFNRLIVAANIVEEDPDELRQDLVDLIRKMNVVAETVALNYEEITVQF